MFDEQISPFVFCRLSSSGCLKALAIAHAVCSDADARATWGCRDRKTQLFTAVKRVSEDLFSSFLSDFLYLLEEGFLLLGLLRRGGQRSMKVCPQIFLSPILDIILKV